MQKLQEKKYLSLSFTSQLSLGYLRCQTLCFRAQKKPINHQGAPTGAVVDHGSVFWCSGGTNGATVDHKEKDTESEEEDRKTKR